MASQPPVCSVTQTRPLVSVSSLPRHTVWASGIWTPLLLPGPKIVGDWATLGCVSPWLVKAWCDRVGSELSGGGRGAALGTGPE